MLKDIKDRSPNVELVKQLEKLLQQAKTGELRTVFTICGWDDDCVTHGWAYDDRSSRRRLLAEMVLLQHDYMIDTDFAENDSVLAKHFTEWE